MSVSYTNSYSFFIYQRTASHDQTYPTLSQFVGDDLPITRGLIFDTLSGGNIYAYDANDSSNYIRHLSGNAWINNTSNKTSSSTFTFDGASCWALSFNRISGNKAQNYSYGAYSVAFGLKTTTRNVGEAAFGIGNINGYTFSTALTKGKSSAMLFSVGNALYEANNEGYPVGSSGNSNIFSVTRDYVVTSGDSYIGYKWNQNDINRFQSYVLSTVSGSSLYVGGNAYIPYIWSTGVEVKRTLKAENAEIATLYLNDSSYALLQANEYDPPQFARASGTTSSGAEYFNNISYSTWSNYVGHMTAQYTISWIDYYESFFKDSICCFKRFYENPVGDEYSLFNDSELISLIKKLRDTYNVFTNTQEGTSLINCYPVFSRTTDGWGNNVFHILITWNAIAAPGSTSTTTQSGTIWVRPCRQVYYVLAALGGDVEFWFRNHTETVNGKSFVCRWSPITQYQDRDSGSNYNLAMSTRVNNQIYFCIEDGKYYIKDYTGDLKEINMGTCAPVDLSLQ